MQHREAFNTPIPLKSEWRNMLATFDEHDDRSRAEFVQRSSLSIGSLIPIPDVKFNSLKALHHKKVELSKLISEHPGSSVTVLRFRMWWRSNWKTPKTNPPAPK